MEKHCFKKQAAHPHQKFQGRYPPGGGGEKDGNIRALVLLTFELPALIPIICLLFQISSPNAPLHATTNEEADQIHHNKHTRVILGNNRALHQLPTT